MNTLGAYLEKLRLSYGYSLHAAARKCGLSHGYIRDVEKGINRNNSGSLIPKPNTLKKFALAYNADFNVLMHLAGYSHEEVKDDFEFLEIRLDQILYIRVNCDNEIEYHLESEQHEEKRNLYDYLLLETKLEKLDFLRIESGLLINLRQIKELSFPERKIHFESTYLPLTWLQFTKHNKTIRRAIDRNTWEEELPSTTSTLIRKTSRTH
ncbi:helix-turn-helix domain-containing protein [Paenibacillus peoriae]|uniref:helix-turn-helix domain-containing protein n=1 Tax=Paenibacillus peoriae TaxID=59893 RepID=UPI000761CD5C|nr:helix-turn-helix transcriptional regulator [Paenibacillus peoriae]